MSSVMRTEKFDAGPDVSCSGFGFGVRKRLDGGYNVASWSGNVVDIVPDTFRFAADFLPSLRLQWRNMRLRVGGKFLEEWQVPRHWALDAPSPFERVRTLDPEPYEPILDQARKHLTAAFPAFRDMQVAESWGGVIDVTPDAVPVISGGRHAAGLLHRHRLHRPWLRHRPRCRATDGRHRDRRSAGGRSDTVPLQPVHRRLTPAAVAVGVMPLDRGAMHVTREVR